jgi:predicted cupin superfamily sugar epimerase
LHLQLGGPQGERPASTAIYYLLTDTTVSRLHQLASDEVWHFYLGDPVDLMQLDDAGQGRVLTLGYDLLAGHTFQAVVPRGVWQGARLRPGGRWALMGCTVAPGYDFSDYKAGQREVLLTHYPAFRDWIDALT